MSTLPRRCLSLSSRILASSVPGRSLAGSQWQTGHVKSDYDGRRVRVLRKYRRVLQDMLGAGSLGEEVAGLQINDLVPLFEKNLVEVHCSLPHIAVHHMSQSRAQALALQVETTVNNRTGEIRTRVGGGRIATFKLPSFCFVIDLAHGLTGNTSRTDVNQSNTEAKAGDANEQLCNPLANLVKPTNAYGLLRNDLLRKISVARQKWKTEATPWNVSQSTNSGLDFDEKGDQRRGQPPLKDWVRMWKEKRNWRLESRQQRKRVHQDHGNLFRLRLGHGESIIDPDDKDAN